jgi:hypothetical protein
MLVLEEFEPCVTLLAHTPDAAEKRHDVMEDVHARRISPRVARRCLGATAS